MNPHVTLMTEEEIDRYLAANPEAGAGALNTPRGRLPLRCLDVQARIDGLLAAVTLRQTFVNGYDVPLEATYIFPLPDRAAVTRFSMTVGGRIVDGVLKERGQARREYAQAIKKGHRAAITEEDRPSTFSLRVGNLMPGEQAVITLTMTGPLPFADGEATFRFPLVVAPRYIPGKELGGPSVGEGTAPDTDAVPDASRITPPVLLPGFPNPVQLAVVVDLHDGGLGIGDVRSSLHVIVEEDGGTARRFRLQAGERVDRDFILRFRVATDAVQTALTLRPDEDAPSGTFLLTLVPPAPTTAPQRPRDVVFVLDRSGSMEGWKMVAARRALARMVDTLTAHDRFTVFAFDDTIETPRRSAPEELLPGTDRQRFRAVEFLAKIASRGGTEMAEPLARAVRLLQGDDPERDRILVLVTDGQVGNEDQILEAIGRQLEHIRVFTLGIDQAVNEGFLHRLAQLGGGTCELVESEDRLDAVMDHVHRCIGTPLLTDLQVAADGLQIDPDSLTPNRLPGLFAGAPLFVFGRYQGPSAGAVVVKARNARGADWTQRLAGQVSGNLAVPCVWARGRLRELEDRYAIGGGNRFALQNEILQTSLRFGVLCRFTAFVAVDRSEIVNAGGEVHRVTQAVSKPAGWGLAEFVDLDGVMIAPSVIELVPESIARENVILPLGQERGALMVIMSDPHDIECLEKLRFILNMDIIPVQAERAQILAAIDRHYEGGDDQSVDEIISEFTDTAIDFTERRSDSEFELNLKEELSPSEECDGAENVYETDFDPMCADNSYSQAVPLADDDSDLESSDFDLALEEDYSAGQSESGDAGIGLHDLGEAEQSPEVRLVNQMLLEAVQIGASEINIEPLVDCVRVRYRIDGVLMERDNLPRRLHKLVIQRIRVMAKVGLAAKPAPQHGTITLAMVDRTYRLHVHVLPTPHGEAVVILIE